MLWGLNDTTTKLTVELRELVESGVDPWDFDYPSFYKGEEKAAFERKVLEHYWFRQIGQETPGRFLAMFRSRIRDIMPYYIQLYESCEIMKGIEDPFESYNLTETFEQETTGSGSSSSSSNRTGKTETESSEDLETSRSGSENTIEKFSDTPQGSIENIEDHMSSATVTDGSRSESGNDHRSGSGSTDTEESGSMESSSEENGSVKHTLTRRGNIGVSTLGEEMTKLRASFLNVDLLVINELNDLFLMIY